MRTVDWPALFHLSQPGYLALLAVLPAVAALGWRSMSGLGRVRQALAVGVRCAVILVMTLALASPEWVRTTNDQTVVFAADQSDSVPADSKRAAEQFIRSASVGMRPGKDRVALMTFDGRASVEQVPQPELVVDQVGRSIEPHKTSISAALRLGLALFPGDTAQRLVVLSDGNENVGTATQEASTYAALGIPVDVVPLRYEHSAEILVDQLSAPATARRDEVINLRLVVRSQVAAGARLFLYHNDRLVQLDAADGGVGMSIQLDAGATRLAIPVRLPTPGVHRFRAVLQPESSATDTLPHNNEGRAFTIAGAAERVLILVDSSSDTQGINLSSAELLARALQSEGLECKQLAVDQVPDDPAALADCSTVILVNVSAFALGAKRQQVLASYVRDQGGGLIVIGGDQAFSVGGYACTPLEEVLPVEASRAKLKLLSLSMIIVIDRSGSMQGEKIAMARQAASASVRLLSDLDRIGVVAFDNAAEWIVGLQPANNKAAVTHQISAIGAGGGTNMYPALQQAYAALAGADANLKHIIVLTDGQSAPGDFETLAQRCAAAGITISTIAVGPDADRDLLTRIARLSGGRMYVADSAQPLPQIFVRETVLASCSGLFEKPFTPRLRPAADKPILSGFAQADIPPLRGHVVTAAKPLAHTPLVRTTEDGADPILAYWQVGLGRTVAFTSGLWPKWGPEWVSWSGFSKFWTQAVRYAGRPGNALDLEVEATVKGDQARILISAENLAPHLRGALTLTGHLVRPDYSTASLNLQRVSSDRVQTTFPVDVPGTYLVSLPYSTGTAGTGHSGMLRTGVVLAYSPEYRTLRDNEAALAEVARRTGGRVLDLNHPDAVFEEQSVRPVQTRRPFWEELVRLTLLLFVLDVAVRRVAVAPAEALRRMRTFFQELAGRPLVDDRAVTLATLRGAKSRLRADQVQAHSKEAALPEPSPPARPRHETDALTRALSDVEPDQPVVSAPAHKRRPPVTSEGDYTARLLRAKRRARRDLDDRGQS